MAQGSYLWFQILITLSVAFVYLSNTLKNYIYEDLYNFLIKNKDLIIGMYYCYLGYEIYRNHIRTEGDVV
jgi:hypothetical protein